MSNLNHYQGMDFAFREACEALGLDPASRVDASGWCAQAKRPLDHFNVAEYADNPHELGIAEAYPGARGELDTRVTPRRALGSTHEVRVSWFYVRMKYAQRYRS